jgi:hypothetical protein
MGLLLGENSLREGVMRSFSIPCLAVLATLSFSAWPDLTGPAQANNVDPCQGLEEWGLFVNGVPADEYVDSIRGNEEAIRRFIQSPPPEGLGIDPSVLDIPSLTSLLRQIDENPRGIVPPCPPIQQQRPAICVPEALQGIGGFSTILVLKKILLSVHQTLFGKIRDYIFVDKTKSGHLSVDMCMDRSEFFHWDIEILDGEYRVHPRQGDPANPRDPYYPDNPFPNVDLELPAAATDPGNPKSIWARDLDHKLHAMGDRIEVRHIYHRRLSEPDLTRLDSKHQLYTSTRASCIDLFTQGRPPATVGELKQKDYCLGRCEHPAIVNTGGG